MTRSELKNHYDAIYPHYRISHLALSLTQDNISQEIMDEILAGGESIRIKKDKEKRNDKTEVTAWFRDAMKRMDRLLDESARRKVRESCACCTGGKRYEMAKTICKSHDSLKDRVKALNDTSYIVGRSAELLDDGRVRVVFGTTAEGGSRCPCMNVSDEVMPITYCYCCGGHIKHHVQAALGVKADCTVVSSLLSSGGKRPCVFELEIAMRPTLSHFQVAQADRVLA